MAVPTSDVGIITAPLVWPPDSGATHPDPVRRLDPPPVLADALVQFHITITGCTMTCRDCGALQTVRPVDVPQQILSFQYEYLECDPVLRLG